MISKKAKLQKKKKKIKIFPIALFENDTVPVFIWTEKTTRRCSRNAWVSISAHPAPSYRPNLFSDFIHTYTGRLASLRRWPRHWTCTRTRFAANESLCIWNRLRAQRGEGGHDNGGSLPPSSPDEINNGPRYCNATVLSRTGVCHVFPVPFSRRVIII